VMGEIMGKLTKNGAYLGVYIIHNDEGSQENKHHTKKFSCSNGNPY